MTHRRAWLSARRCRAANRLVTAVLAATLAGAAATLQGTATPATAAQVAAAPASAARAGGPDDLAVAGSGDPSGYHLYLASRQDGWRWRTLATIQPGGDEDQRWIGQDCLTGDGRTVVAVIAPWSASNSVTGMDAGGLAYAVTVPAGKVTPLASGVSLAYFNPGCGLGSDVALTSYGGPQQRPTKISVLDAATGAVTASSTVPGEITSAVPAAGGRILAARGGELLDVTGNRATELASFPGQVSSLHPAASGGVDLVAQSGHGQAGIWSAGHGLPVRQLGAGPAVSLRLFAGLGGRNLAAGAASLTPDSGLGLLAGVPDLTGASLRGGLELAERTGVQHTVAAADGRSIAEAVAGTGGVHGVDLPAPSARRTELLPRRSVAVGATSARVTTATRTITTAAAAGAVTGTPQCAVPRNDIYKQVWQPSSAQVRWAVNQAVQGYLTSAYPDADRPPDASMYATTDGSGTLPQAYASQDFPPVAGTPNVPPLVMYGILAQESNWSQASWHAIPGRSGNPLVANYYGDDANADSVDYSKADCGYGIAQVTTGMMQTSWTGSDTGQIAPPSAQQLRVAVDYATNIAAGVQLLQEKWRDLHTLGITMNNDDPTKIENWYAAIWAYNTGVYMSPQLGGEGLGWLNNPANPIYPSPRHAFLHNGFTETYGDASTPNLWPYQERVFGWMDVPQLDAQGNQEYNGTFDWANATGHFLYPAPDTTFCSLTYNSCDPSVIGTTSNGSQVDPCPDEDSACWWDQPVTWANCTTNCVTDTPTNTPSGQTDYPGAGAAEPPAAPLSSTCAPGAGTPVTTSSGSLLPGTVLVDDEMLSDQNQAGNTPNLMGCSGDNTVLIPPASAHASFALEDVDGQPIDGDATPSDVAAIDLHQLGAGLGGHLFFTHTIPASQSAQEVQGVWSATLPASTTTGTVYQIYAFVPDIAAGAGYAPYQISTGGASGSGTGYGAPGNRHASLYRVIDQASYTNQWVSLGYYLCGGIDTLVSPVPKSGPANCTMNVTLSNVTPNSDSTQGSDIAYDAVAFVPAPLGRNVIIGDSYSSGEGLQGGFDDGTDVSASVPRVADNNGDLCHRAPGAYGRLWDPNAIQLACSGSNMWDVAGVLYYQNLGSHAIPANNGSVYYSPPSGSTISNEPSGSGWTANGPAPNSDNWNFDYAGSDYYGEPTFQTELLRALKPKRVILTLGGDDAMFADVILNCTNLPSTLTSPCQNQYAIAGSSTDKLDNRITSLAKPLQAAFRNIASAAGGASKVVVLTYPNIFAPSPGVQGNVPDCSYVGTSDEKWLVGKTQKLDNTITSAASAAGIPSGNIVNEYDAFLGYELCATSTTGDISDVTEPSAAAIASGAGPSVVDNYFHPNADGYIALEQKLAAQIGSP